MKPMLAKKYNEQKHKLDYPLFVQPKLNGVRALYSQGQFQSRDEHLWRDECLQYQRLSLRGLPNNVILDGELYRHGWSLQKINSSVSVNRLEDNALTHEVRYCIFDCVITTDLSMPFGERFQYLKAIKDDMGLALHLVSTHYVRSELETEPLYRMYKEQDYEGLMYRQNAPYGIEGHCGNKENRWDILLKRKEWLDEDCEIIGIELGSGKYADCVGSLVLVFENGQEFTAGSGLSDSERRRFLDNPPIGRLAKIKYEMLSDSGVPLKPTIECVYD